MPKLSEARRNSRRQQILDAALACFSENGFHQTGMADIVRRSGMSHGAVYVYFPGKDDIIEALADDRHGTESSLNAISQETADPVQALHALVRAYADDLNDPGAAPRRRVSVHGWAEALRSPRVHARVVEGIDVPRALIARLIERAQNNGEVSNELRADAVARAIIALFQGLVLQSTWGEDLDLEASVTVVERMLQGLAQAASHGVRHAAARD